MPRRKEIEEAWKIHDSNPDEFECQKDKDFSSIHSHYNKACKRKVLAYAQTHPIVRQKMEQQKVHKEKCRKCGKKLSKRKMIEMEIAVKEGVKEKIEKVLWCSKCIHTYNRSEQLKAKKLARDILKRQQLIEEAVKNCKNFGNGNFTTTTCMQCKYWDPCYNVTKQKGKEKVDNSSVV
jgi:hypothetical protein